MSAALKEVKINDKFQDSLFLFLELIRGGVLHGRLWSGRAYSGGPSFGEGMFDLPVTSECSCSMKLAASRG